MALKLCEPGPLGKAAKRLQRFRVSATRYRVPGAPYCDAPVPIYRTEKPAKGGYVGLEFEMLGPCRRCPKCLTFRALRWAERIQREAQSAARNWLVTLTFSPQHLALILLRSKRDEEELERVAYRDLQLWLKRLRKAGAQFRFAAVPEYGEEKGRLHYHLIMHEAAAGSLTKRLMQAHWPSFSHCRLVRGGAFDLDRTARYVSKYLTKSLFRPRASRGYGKRQTMTCRAPKQSLLRQFQEQRQ